MNLDKTKLSQIRDKIIKGYYYNHKYNGMVIDDQLFRDLEWLIETLDQKLTNEQLANRVS